MARAVVAVALVLLAGCGGLRGPELDPKEHVRGERQRLVQVPFEQLWPAVVGALPDAVFVIDVGYHKIAVTEAKKLGIPIVAVVDTNHSPDGIAYVIPGNDDSSRAIRLYARGVADAVLEGKSQSVQEIVQGGDEFVEVAEDASA